MPDDKGWPAMIVIGPIELFEHEGPDDLVRNGQGTEGEHQGCTLAQLGIEPVGASDQQGRGRGSCIACRGESVGECVAVEALAALVQGDDEPGRRQAFADQLCLLAAAFLGTATAGPSVELDDIRPAEAEATSKALGTFLIAGAEIAFRPVLEATDGDDRKAHESERSAVEAFARPVGAPHLFEIVELAHFPAGRCG
jgi:hypothetical protein